MRQRVALVATLARLYVGVVLIDRPGSGRVAQQDMGRSRGGLTSKIHAVVDTNGLPVHLALKQRRRVATRYDKLAANYLAFVKLASIRLATC